MHSVVLDSVHKMFRGGGFFSLHPKNETHAVNGISLQVSPGEVIALLGPNGSGKSTTLKLMSTLLLPDRGRILVGGSDTRTGGSRVRAQVGLALASERSFYPRLTVRENLDFFAALENIPRGERASCIQQGLRSVNLEHAADKQAMKLSSGMFQRLGIARSLIKQPSVLLLDEPTRSLDPAAAADLWSTVRELARSGISILLATHNFAEAIAVADRVAILRAGQLMALRANQGITTDSLRNYYLRLTSDEQLERWEEEVPA